MSEEVRQRIKAGERPAIGSMKIPMVDLPLGATEDRVCGTIDIEKALTEGARLRACVCWCACGCLCGDAGAVGAPTGRARRRALFRVFMCARGRAARS
jgi:hypothetical protein